MSDHDQDTETCSDASAGAALDVLLTKHQMGLHTALAGALDTRAGFARLVRTPIPQWSVVSPPDIGRQTPAITVRVTDPKMWVVESSSTLASAVDAVEEELEAVEALIDEIEEHQDRDATPPGAQMSPIDALLLVHSELTRIADLLAGQEITKESAGSEFDVLEATLDNQVAAWTDKVADAPRNPWHIDMREAFLDRAESTMLLHKMIVRLFEEADETVLQFN
ncbi:hypothetical protein ACWGDE_10685 [Streptomyces sp. NPDC054956]